MDSITRTLSDPSPGFGGNEGGRRMKVHFTSEIHPPIRQDSIQSSTGTAGISGRTWDGSETSSVEHVVDVDTPIGHHSFSSSEDEFEPATPGPNYHRRRNPFIDASFVFGDASGRTIQYHEHGTDDPEHKYSEDEPDIVVGEGGEGEGNGKTRRRRKNSREAAPEQKITIFALRLALIEKTASGLGTLSFLWATVVILGGYATTVNETDFLVVTLIILAESSRIFSRSHELEWQHLSVRSHEGLTQRFFRAASSSYRHNVTIARAVKSKVKSLIHAPVRGDGDTTAGVAAASPPPPNSKQRRLSRKSKNKRPAVHQIKVVESKTKDQIRTWNAPSMQLLPYTHHLVTTKMISRLLYAVQLLSAITTIGLAMWRLIIRDFFYNFSDNQQKPPNTMLSMNVFYVLSVVEAGMFLIERMYWEYRIRVTELLQKVNEEAELGPENLVTVKQFFYDVYSRCLTGSVFDGLEMDLVSFSISWLEAEDFNQQLGGARLLNRIVSYDYGKPRKDTFAADCLRRLETTPGIMERLVEMLSWNSKQEEPLLTEVAVIICRLVVDNRNCSRIVAIPGSIEGIINLLLPNEWPRLKDGMDYAKQTKAYLELRVNGLRILKYFCKDHKNCVRIGEAKGLLPILIVFIDVRNGKALDQISSDRTDTCENFSVYHLKTYKKSLQVIGLMAAATNTSAGLLRRRIADVVSGLKNLRDMIDFGDSQPELQSSAVEILFHLAMDSDVRKTIGATGGIIRNLYDLFASYDEINSMSSSPTAISEDPDHGKKSGEERQRVSEMAGKTLSRIILQNERNCLKLLSMKSEHGETFLNCMVRFLLKPMESQNTGPREIASCSAQILRTVMFYADETVKRQVAEDSTPVVLQLFQRRIREGRSSLYESYLGLASRTINYLSRETFARLIGTIISDHDMVLQHLVKNLKHTPTTSKYPRIRRYCVELIIVLCHKQDSFVQILRSVHVNLNDMLQSTLDSISEVENFCLFSGLVGYTRHEEEMEDLVVRAIQLVESVDQPGSPDHRP